MHPWPGCGKTSVAHLLAAGEPARPAPRPTVGCATHVAQLDGGEAFVELWDVGALACAGPSPPLVVPAGRRLTQCKRACRGA